MVSNDIHSQFDHIIATVLKKNGENNTKTGNNSLRRFEDVVYIWRVVIV